ncbi:hypothetical protein cypCar_00049667 [Cyprinus carpio]|nr:hypothetical protein cypCar_00049667 [Cyprinus carpio]
MASLSYRTFTFEADAGLRLGKWENTTAISLHLSPQQRKNLLANFKAAIQIPTVSFTETNVNTSALREFDALLKKVFPKVFSSSLVQHEMVGNYSHLLTVNGLHGAANIVKLLKSRGVKLQYVLDEGLAVLDGVISGLDGPAALLEENPMPRLFGYGPERGTFEHLAHKFGLPLRFIMSNLWLFSPLLSR